MTHGRDVDWKVPYCVTSRKKDRQMDGWMDTVTTSPACECGLCRLRLCGLLAGDIVVMVWL